MHNWPQMTTELSALLRSLCGGVLDVIALHVKAAVEQGATKEEISETLGMAIYMGAGPSVMHASDALQAFSQFEAKATDRSSIRASVLST